MVFDGLSIYISFWKTALKYYEKLLKGLFHIETGFFWKFILDLLENAYTDFSKIPSKVSQSTISKNEFQESIWIWRKSSLFENKRKQQLLLW